MRKKPTRITIADDHQPARKLWKELLETNRNFIVAADCENGPASFDCIKKSEPDVLLVDINVSHNKGFSLARLISEEMPDVKIIGLSVYNQPKYAQKMIEIGAKGYITKTSSLEEILHGIVEVIKGKNYICKEIKNQKSAAR